MLKQTVSGGQNEAATQGSSSGPVCWYPGPETWNYGTGPYDANEHDIALNGAGLAQGEDLLFV